MPNLVPGEGPIPSIGMIIGEAPGRLEDQEGRPFVGPSGELLNEALRAAGAEREQFYITNSYKFRPENNRDPSPAELEEGKPDLLNEIAEVGPLVIMTLGNIALGNLTGTFGGITRRHGQIEQLRNTSGESIDLVPVYHPAYVLRNRSAKPAFLEDVQLFVERSNIDG